MKHSLRFASHAMRGTAVALAVFLWAGSPAVAQVSVGISMPGVSIGINMPIYPQLVRVPNYPVYYAPRLDTNFFFYDGMYWVYQNDEWYASSWYNGPWALVSPQMVPLFVLRIPVRYYRNPPDYFRGWRSDAPPRWGDHWGHQWAQQRSGWDRWDRRAIPAPAPLPVYQRQYSGDRYPQAPAQQQALQSRNYRYQPRDAIVRQHFQQQAAPVAPAPAPRVQQAAPVRAPDQQGRPALQARPQPQAQSQRAQQQERQQQQRVQRAQPPQQPQPAQPPQPAQHPRAQQGGERGQPPARGANERAQQPAARAAAPAPEQVQRQGQGPGQGRAAGKAKGRQQERDDEGEGGRQGRK